jgi:hypothetical protein
MTLCLALRPLLATRGSFPAHRADDKPSVIFVAATLAMEMHHAVCLLLVALRTLFDPRGRDIPNFISIATSLAIKLSVTGSFLNHSTRGS